MKKKMKCTGIVLLAIIMLSLSLRIQSRADEKTYTLTMTMHDALTSVNGEWYQNWADQIYEATDGHVEIKIFGSAQLCQGPDVVDYVLSRPHGEDQQLIDQLAAVPIGPGFQHSADRNK